MSIVLPWLDDSLTFPSLHTALTEPDGLLAAGGDLSPERLLTGYSQGIFPWFQEDDPILWWSPLRRMVLFPEQLNVSRSLSKSLRNRSYQIRINTAFEQVMQECAAPRDEEGGTWILPQIVDAYCILHQLGYAHSFEVWEEGELTGGLYGVGLGRMFFGESMFSRRSDASKIAFVHMVRHLSRYGVKMIDCQMYTAHLASLGAQLVAREQFIAMLKIQIIQPQAEHMWVWQGHADDAD